ncbi:NfeD family protein [bacterium]|nr:NfeD family protein [bacterium]
MEAWPVWGVIGIILIAIEMFTPTLFFLNLAFAAILTGVISFYTNIFVWQELVIFILLSFVMVLFLRPLFLKTKNSPEISGIEGKYIGQNAVVVTKVDGKGGRIAIYGEEWNAKTAEGLEIEPNEMVKIVAYEDLTFFVEQI